MNKPRRHHILPQFYLAGFTDTGKREGYIHVFDYEHNTRYRTRLKKIAVERDFYRMYEPESDPYEVEGGLAKVEDQCAPVLRRVIETGRFHGGKELGTILSLVALIYARGHVARERISMGIQQTMMKKIRDGEVTREQWGKTVAAEIRAGVDPSMLPPFADMKGLIERGEWQPKAPEVVKVGLIPEAQEFIFNSIVDRTWSLARAPFTSGGFICSDTPLSWSDSPLIDPYASGARIDDPSHVVTFPLSKDLALVTRDDGWRGTYQAVAKVVAWVNSRTHLGSRGTLYSPSEDFLLLREQNQIGHSTDYFDFVKQARDVGIENP